MTEDVQTITNLCLFEFAQISIGAIEKLLLLFRGRWCCQAEITVQMMIQNMLSAWSGLDSTTRSAATSWSSNNSCNGDS